MLRTVLALTLSVLATLALAAPQVRVVGLFSGAAVLNIDGQRRLLKVGQTSPEGVQVVSADSRKAVLRIDGVERTFELSREYSDGYSVPQQQALSIARGVGGHYWVAGSINGQSVQFLVDTGATAVAMNEAQAQRLGLDFRVNGQPMLVNTASGSARAWRMKLDRVKVGSLEVLGVEAIMIEGGSPADVLLGMSYLNRVGWREDQGMLILEAKH
ncbi:hypothetical protein D3C76_500140 [compost metagenome]|nr:TIGR02281 family clan AA aspartic protease [Pseudomonas jinjuensis]